MRLLVLAPCSVALALVAGCSWSEDRAVRANGVAQQLLFDRIEDANVGTVPFGVTRTIVVERYSGGEVDCALGSSNVNVGPIRTEGGGKPDIPTHCDQIASEQVALVSASCPDDACIVTSEEKDTYVVLRVTAKSTTPVSTELRVSLQKKGATDVWSDSVAIAFAPAKGISLGARIGDATAFGSVLLPAVSMQIPSAKVVGEDDKPMSLDSDAMKSAIVGDAVAGDLTSGEVTAKAKGTASIVWDVPGVAHRELSIEVAAPTDVKALVVAAAPKATYETGWVDPAATSVPALGGFVDAISVAPNTSHRFDVHAELLDGRYALVAMDEPVVDSKLLVDAYQGAPDELVILSSYGTGSGTITLTAAGMTRKIPITVK